MLTAKEARELVKDDGSKDEMLTDTLDRIDKKILEACKRQRREVYVAIPDDILNLVSFKLANDLGYMVMIDNQDTGPLSGLGITGITINGNQEVIVWKRDSGELLD